MGAKLLNKVTMFSKVPLRVSKDVEFEIKGDEKFDVAVTGIQSGTWKVSVNGTELGDYYATEEGGMVYFKTTAGKITLKHISSEVKDTFTNNEDAYNFDTAKRAPIEFRVNNAKRYSKNPLVIKNGSCYIPLKLYLKISMQK